ncbi:hypothetical protein [Azospirillum sp.]|uniref:hypothetical protein n=1 Tax=Azospirillum sp. TaxID=34012 RepID=UPI003D72332B
MLSFSKLLLLALVIGAVWYGWRWFQRVDAVRRDQLRRQAAPQPQPRRDSPAASAGPTAMDAEDMEKCPECGAWVAPRSATSCGRAGCPYGR